jgi:hypothetical protein
MENPIQDLLDKMAGSEDEDQAVEAIANAFNRGATLGALNIVQHYSKLIITKKLNKPEDMAALLSELTKSLTKDTITLRSRL